MTRFPEGENLVLPDLADLETNAESDEESDGREKLRLETNQLIAEICNEESLRRKEKKKNELIRKVERSNRILSKGNVTGGRQSGREGDWYDTARQSAWVSGLKNLDKYDPNKKLKNGQPGTFWTWLNRILKWRYADLREGDKLPINSTDGFEDILQDFLQGERVEAEQSRKAYQAKLDQIIEDPNRKLRDIHVRNRPDINAQSVILSRIMPIEPPLERLRVEYPLPNDRIKIVWTALIAKENGLMKEAIEQFWTNNCVLLLNTQIKQCKAQSDAQEAIVWCLKHWLEMNPNSELEAMICLEEGKSVNAQGVLSAFWNHDSVTWEELAKAFDAPFGTLTAFWKRKCQALIMELFENGSDRDHG